jgi:hypothetical protein
VEEWSPEHLVDEWLARRLIAEVSRQQLLSARVLAWFMCSTLAVYADKEGREDLLGEALTGPAAGYVSASRALNTSSVAMTTLLPPSAV